MLQKDIKVVISKIDPLKISLKILIVPFCARQFDVNNKKCTQIDSTIAEFQHRINEFFSPEKLKDGYKSKSWPYKN